LAEAAAAAEALAVAKTEVDTWKPKPPVGRQDVIYAVRHDIGVAIVEDIRRGDRRHPKVQVRIGPAEAEAPGSPPPQP
jgi:hypothetical protein